MELSLMLGKQTLSMFIMMGVGFAIVRSKFLKADETTALSKMMLYVTVPCALFNAFQMDFSMDKLSGFCLSLFAGVFIHLMFIGMARLLKKPLKLTPVESTSLAYSNSLNMVLPLVTATLGPEQIFYTVPYCVAQTFLLWTHCESSLRGEWSFSWKKIFLNTNVIAIAIGLVCFLFGLKLPGIVNTAVTSLGGMVGPMGMLIAGMLLAKMNIKSIFCNARAYMICFLRLFAFPLTAILVLKFSGLMLLHPDAEMIFMITMLAAGSSVATTVMQMSQIYGQDSGYASVLNGMSIMGCVVTLPVLIFIYQML